MATIEKLRGGRRLVCLCNFDRAEEPVLNTVNAQFQEDVKEPLYRVLRETLKRGDKLDLFLYTRGGKTNAVWPIVSLLREFDCDFAVLVPFRAHSSGTLLSLGAREILMGTLAELSPIDPTTANQFNPRDPNNSSAVLGIGVEDLIAYRAFWEETTKKVGDGDTPISMEPFLARLLDIHPLALGNAHRVYQQIRELAKMLLKMHYGTGENVGRLVERLTTEFYSHHHMIGRMEAQDILGKDHVKEPGLRLDRAMDKLLRKYEDDFDLRSPFYLTRYMGDDAEKQARFVAGAVESTRWGYLYETRVHFRQYIAPPSGIQIQIQPGEQTPLVPGLPRKVDSHILSRGWVRNKKPLGVTV